MRGEKRQGTRGREGNRKKGEGKGRKGEREKRGE